MTSPWSWEWVKTSNVQFKFSGGYHHIEFERSCSDNSQEDKYKHKRTLLFTINAWNGEGKKKTPKEKAAS